MASTFPTDDELGSPHQVRKVGRSRDTWPLFLAATLTYIVSGCSFAFQSDRAQCTTDEECRALGGPDLTCAANLCIPAQGHGVVDGGQPVGPDASALDAGPEDPDIDAQFRDGGNPDASEPVDGGPDAQEPEEDAGMPGEDGGPPTCATGRADCDGIRSNGCEVDLRSNVTHCGACRQECPALRDSPPMCSASRCMYDGLFDVDDAFVDSSRSRTNFGDDDALFVDGLDTGSAIYETLIQPRSIDAIPSDAEIVAAHLELECVNSGDVVEVRGVRSAWSESSVTWRDFPELSSVEAYFTPDRGLVRIDLTTLVRRWVRGELAPHGVYLGSDGSDGSDYRSSEHPTSSTRPRFHVIWR